MAGHGSRCEVCGRRRESRAAVEEHKIAVHAVVEKPLIPPSSIVDGNGPLVEFSCCCVGHIVFPCPKLEVNGPLARAKTIHVVLPFDDPIQANPPRRTPQLGTVIVYRRGPRSQ